MVTVNHSPNGLLAALPPADFELLRPHLRSVDLTFGQVLVEAGASIKQVYFPHCGIVSCMVQLRRGETIEVTAIGRDGAVGSWVVMHEAVSPAAAIVRFPGTASVIDAAHFRAVAEHSDAMRMVLMRDQWNRLLKAEQTAACNAAHPAEARLCRRLLQSRDMARSDSMSLSQDMMAQMLGVKRNTISLIAHELQEKGLIRYSRGRLAIVDPEGLARRSCECHAADRLHLGQSELRAVPTVLIPRLPVEPVPYQRNPS
jgi:CRP-like cAMP-binding protein